LQSGLTATGDLSPGRERQDGGIPQVPVGSVALLWHDGVGHIGRPAPL